MNNLSGKIGKSAGFAALSAMLIWSLWRSGLYFAADAYVADLALYGALAVWIGAKLLRNRSFDSAPLALLPLGLAASYGFLLLAGPASVQGTTDAALRWTAYACWLAMTADWRTTPGNRGWGPAAIEAAGVFLLAGGWLGWFGALTFPDIVLRFQDPELSSTGARLAGFLQYPNTYGAVLAFFLTRQWQAWAGAGKKGAAVASVLTIPYAGALLLTESRGAWLALAAGFGLAWLLAGNRAERIRLWTAAAMTAIGASAAAQAAASADADGAWVAAAVCAAGALVLHAAWRHMQKAGPQGGLRLLWVNVVLTLTGVLAVAWRVGVGMGGGRLSDSGTAASRLLFYEDGWRMFRDAPWIGRGGESWRVLFGLYQRQPYVGGEVHSGYLSLVLEAGLLGFVLFAAMLAICLRRVWKYRRQAIAPAVVLLLHAAFDFDLSYGWTWLLLFAWMAFHMAAPHVGEDEVRRPTAWREAGRRAAAALLLVSAAWCAWTAWHSLAAARAAAAADEAAAPAAREALLRAALEANPASARIRLVLATLLPEAKERASVLAAGLRYEPQSSPLLLQLGLAEAELGDVAQAEERLREALRLERFSRDSQTAAIAAMTRLAQAMDFAGRPDEARRAAEAACAFFERYEQLVREVEAMDSPANGKGFAMTQPALYQAAQAYALLGRNDRALELLAPLLKDGSEDWKKQARELANRIRKPSP